MMRFTFVFAALLCIGSSGAVAQTYLAEDLEITNLAAAQQALRTPFEAAQSEVEASEAGGAVTLSRYVYGGTAAQRVETCAELIEASNQSFTDIENNDTAFYGDWLKAKCTALSWLANAQPPRNSAPRFDAALMAQLPGWFTTDRSCRGIWQAMQRAMTSQNWDGATAVDFTQEGQHGLSFQTEEAKGSIQLLAFADLDGDSRNGDSKGEMIVLFELTASQGAIDEMHIIRLKQAASGAWQLFDPAHALRMIVRNCPDQLGLAFAGACTAE